MSSRMKTIVIESLVETLAEKVRLDIKGGATGSWYDMVMDAWVEYMEESDLRVSLETRRIVIKDTIKELRGY